MSVLRSVSRFCAGLWLLSLVVPAASAPDGTEWPAYRGGPASIQYSPLNQINRHNVQALEVAWVLDPGDSLPDTGLQFNPLVVDGMIYVVSPSLSLVAADAGTGEKLWRFDPNKGRRILGSHPSRGLAYWSDGEHGRLFFAAHQYLYALEAKTGQVLRSFGRDGRIDLREGLGRDAADQTVRLTTPGAVYRDLLIIGSSVSELLPAAYGDIRAYDVRTGERRWTFHTIPRPGEFGYDTWPEDTWRHTGGANSWAGLSLDEARGIVYVPTGSAAFDYYGGDRAGDNLFANSLLALHAATGKRIWHFQTVHHDTWDRDLPAAPSLVTVMRDGKAVDAVAQPTKSGHLFLFERGTGEPLFPIEERPVPIQGLPGEAFSPTQPFPVKPVPFARQAFDETLVTERTPEARAAVLEQLEQLGDGVPFAPMSLTGTIVQPSLNGGAEWGGAAWDPEIGLLYVNANDVPWVVRLRKHDPTDAAGTGRGIYLQECAACHGADRWGQGEYPALIDLGERYTRLEVQTFVARGGGRMPGFDHLGWASLHAVAEYLTTGKDTTVADGHSSSSTSRLSYTIDEFTRLQDPDGYPGIKPPWGTLSAIDLNTGEYAWRVPLGEYPELAARGLPDTGSENYGGPVVTAGGLVFIGATVHDRKFRAFDKETGALLWETTLPGPGRATPAVYEVGGRQFVVIAAGGDKAGTSGDGPSEDNGGARYVAFALPEASIEK